jgi:hypothetical protein
LYYYDTLRKEGRGTCGGEGQERGLVEYYGNTFMLPQQASYIQVGCGELKYVGRLDPFCRGCPV